MLRYLRYFTLDQIQAIRQYVTNNYESLDDARFDIASACYWYASDWYDGQTDPLYASLCTNPYRPGCLESGPEDYASDIYSILTANRPIR